MDELSEIRSGNDSKEIERDESPGDYNKDLVTEELNNNEDDSKDNNYETNEEEFSTETEEAI